MAKLTIEVEPKFVNPLEFHYTTVGKIEDVEYHGDVVREYIVHWSIDRETAKKACIDNLVASYRTVLEKIYEAEGGDEQSN